ncbi:hypothetical protein GH714_010680 [Hevea brasiliensis]|uniref:Uncharacterized protein n=1 Tax=Hevea brasiliensis TaxID=3981 RepID=A0A6A6KP89_HEVBR|nr:hypothetical protein GH714_010680 [Hevea brasiliensis]
MTESLSCEEPSLVMVASNSYGQQMIEDKLIAKIVSARKYNPWVLKNTLSKIMSSPFAPSGGTLDNPSIITTNVQGPSLQILALSMQSPNVSNHRRAHSPRKSDNYYFPDLPNLLSLYRNSMTTTIPNSLPLFEDSKLGKIAATMNTVPIDGTLISPTAKLSVATIDQGRKEGETSSQKLLIPLDRVGSSFNLGPKIVECPISKPISFPIQSTFLESLDQYSLWANKKWALKKILPQLQLKKPKNYDPSFFEPKPLDYLVHLACSIYKLETIISGPSPVEIAFIINLKVPTLSKEGNINGTQVEGQFAIEKTKKENDVAGMECSSQ